MKEGLGRYTCLSLFAQAARDLIRELAATAMRKIGQIRPYKIQGPATLEIEYTTRNSLPPGAELRPGAKILGDRTIRYRGRDFLEAWTRYETR